MRQSSRFHILTLLLGMLVLQVDAQQGVNPFEIIPRLGDSLRFDSTAAGTLAAETEEAVVAVPEPAPPEAVAPPEADRSDLGERVVEGLAENDPGYRRLKLVVTLLILVVLAFMLTVLRSLVRRSVGAFLYANMTNQVYREHEGRGFGPFITLYTLFFLNGGVFLFYLSRYFGWIVHPSPLVQLVYCVGGVTAVFLGKHLILSILSYIFPIQAEVSRYHFIIIVFGISLGIFLVPVNLLLAYAPRGLVPVLVYASLLLMVVAYLFRQFRALLNGWKLLLANKFHFFLYICTIEIAPAIFLYYYALDQL